jgi:secreted trypsin-like serine protease
MIAKLICIVSFSGLFVQNATALVGRTEAAGQAARHTVMVLKRQSGGASFCSGVIIAPRVILTAAHCVRGARGIAVYLPGPGQPKLHIARRIAVHPGYVANAIKLRKRSVDLALVQSGEALPQSLSPAIIGQYMDVKAGATFRIAGFGLQREGVESSAGTLRAAKLIVRPPLSDVLLWLRPLTGTASGACTGDSGGPVFTADSSALVAITVWARGKGKKRCGDLTQAVRVAPQRSWINTVLAKWAGR